MARVWVSDSRPRFKQFTSLGQAHPANLTFRKSTVPDVINSHARHPIILTVLGILQGMCTRKWGLCGPLEAPWLTRAATCRMNRNGRWDRKSWEQCGHSWPPESGQSVSNMGKGMYDGLPRTQHSWQHIVVKGVNQHTKLYQVRLPNILSVGSDGKASVYNAGDPGSIPGSGRSPGEGNGNPRQYYCLENPTDRGAW